MDLIVGFMFSLYGLFALFCLIALIYFIVKRLDDKKREDFEKRDN